MSGRGRLRPLVSAAVVCCLLSGCLVAEEAAGTPPLQLRELFPLTAQFLSHRPQTPFVLERGAWEWGLGWTASNALVQSDVVEENLERSGQRKPIDVDFLRTAALRDPTGEIYHLDAELSRAVVSVRYGLGRRLELAVELAILDLGGGFLDAAVEGFHEVIDNDQDGRVNLPRNVYTRYFLTPGSESFANRSPGPGVADPVVSLKRSLPAAGAWSLGSSMSVKLPFAGDGGAYTSGSFDSELALLASRSLGRGRLFVSLAALWLGPAVEPATSRQLLLASATSYVRPLGARWTLHLQLRASQNPLASQPYERLSEAGTFYWILGFERRLTAGQFVSFALTEDLIHYENSADIAITLGWRIRR